jgi:hypothetical protein
MPKVFTTSFSISTLQLNTYAENQVLPYRANCAISYLYDFTELNTARRQQFLVQVMQQVALPLVHVCASVVARDVAWLHWRTAREAQWLCCGEDVREIVFRSSVGVRDLSPLLSANICPAYHPASYLVHVGIKTAVVWNWPHISV